MDAELEELQRRLEATQQARATARLSERNVVELVSKLQAMRLLDSDLLHTVTGKEYLTQERLRIEVEAEVKRLGRVSLVDLAASVGVELIHCERAAEEVVARNPALTIVQGEIIADTYWQAVAEEIDEALQESGHVSVGELAKRYNVGAELLTRTLESRIATSEVKGKLEAGQLYTPAFVARIRAMVRGAIRALTVPTPLSEVWSMLQREVRDGDDGSGGAVPGLFQYVFNEIDAAGEVAGTLRGGGASWIPAIFAKSQRESVEAFYSQNGYVSYDSLRKLVIAQPKSFLQEKYPEGIALDTVFVHTSLISVVDAAAEEAINGGGWVDTFPLVPSSFSNLDVAMLVKLCPSVQKAVKDSAGLILAETCVVSLSFIKVLQERLDGEVRTLAKRAAEEQGLKAKQGQSDWDRSERAPSSNSGQAGTERDVDGVEDNTQGKKQKRRRGSQHSAREGVKEVADEESGGKGAKLKRRGGKNKGGISLLVGEPGAGTSGVGKGSLEKEESDVLSEQALIEKILEWYPDMDVAGIEGENSGDFGTLARCLAEWVRPSLLATWMAAKSASLTASSEDRRRRLDNLQKRIDEVYPSLQLFEKALEVFSEDHATTAILEKHLLRTTAAEIVDLFLIAQNIEKKEAEGENIHAQEDTLAHDSLTGPQRMSLAKNVLGTALSSRAMELVETLEGKSMGAFESALESAVTESGLRLRKLDKKMERSLLHSHRKLLTAEVEEEADPIALLPKVVALLFVQVHNRALQAPGRAIAAAVARLKNGISDEHHGQLLEYHKITVQLLSMEATAGSDKDDCTSDRVRTKRDALVKRMPELKSMAVPSDVGGKTRK